MIAVVVSARIIADTHGGFAPQFRKNGVNGGAIGAKPLAIPAENEGFAPEMVSSRVTHRNAPRAISLGFHERKRDSGHASPMQAALQNLKYTA